MRQLKPGEIVFVFIVGGFIRKGKVVQHEGDEVTVEEKNSEVRCDRTNVFPTDEKPRLIERLKIRIREMKRQIERIQSGWDTLSEL